MLPDALIAARAAELLHEPARILATWAWLLALAVALGHEAECATLEHGGDWEEDLKPKPRCRFELRPFSECGKVATHIRIAYWGEEFLCKEHAKVAERMDDAVVVGIKSRSRCL